MIITVNDREMEVPEDATFEEVALKVNLVLKANVWGCTHVLINGNEREFDSVIRAGDDLLFVYEQYNFKNEDDERVKRVQLAAYLAKHRSACSADDILGVSQDGILESQ